MIVGETPPNQGVGVVVVIASNARPPSCSPHWWRVNEHQLERLRRSSMGLVLERDWQLQTEKSKFVGLKEIP